MPIAETKNMTNLSVTISVRLSEAECRAIAVVAQRDDRTLSYIVRAQLRRMLQEQGRTT